MTGKATRAAVITVVAAAFFFAGAGFSAAFEEYAVRTGRPCAECHLDPGGGGDLTVIGARFASGGHRWPMPEGATGERAGMLMNSVRFALGFTHLVAAIVWFGTIFYVHIVLRPRYAAGGLPKGEMKIAWMAIAALGLTGVLLTRLRFHEPAALLATRSGVLLLVKIGLYLTLLFSAAYVTLRLSPRLRKAKADWQGNDGLEGRPAWVRVGGRIYDLSASPKWAGGSHFKRHRAGEDLSEALKTAPHGPEKLSEFPSFEAGAEILQSAADITRLYFLAYANLALAFGVILIIALWRWG